MGKRPGQKHWLAAKSQCTRSVDGPCWGKGLTPGQRSIGWIGRESGIRQGCKSRARATLAPQPSGSPELPGCTHRAGGGREDTQHLAPAAGLSPGRGPSPSEPQTSRAAHHAPCGPEFALQGTGSFAARVGEGKEGVSPSLHLLSSQATLGLRFGHCVHRCLSQTQANLFIRGIFPI